MFIIHWILDSHFCLCLFFLFIEFLPPIYVYSSYSLIYLCLFFLFIDLIIYV